MKSNKLIILLLMLLCCSINANAAMNTVRMVMDEQGMVINANRDTLPRDCPKVSSDVDLVIHAGQKYARKFNGKMYAYDQQQWDVPACSRINLTFINDDDIRHQLMLHGLPGYIYPKGMFTIELNGKGRRQASLIVPARSKTYLIHCEVPQHMEKGMKAQLKVAGGDGDLSSIPGLTEPVTAELYPVAWNRGTWGLLFAAILVGFGLSYYLMRLLK